MLNPIDFPSPNSRFLYADSETFLKTHDTWVKIEMDRELDRVRDFNEAGKAVKAYLLRLPDWYNGSPNYTIRVDFSGLINIAPQLGEYCQVQLIDMATSKESTWARAQRIRSEIFQGSDAWKDHLDFAVADGSPGWADDQWKNVLGESIVNMETEKLQLQGPPAKCRHFTVRLTLRPSTATYEAERATLREAAEIWKSATQQKAVLDTLILCKEAGRVVDLSRTLYQHLPFDADWNDLDPKKQSTKAFQILRKFNADQIEAIKLMRSLPDGLAFVPGCPGSGKTTWALETVALAQSGPRKVQTLYLLDINNTVDDAADRMARLYRQWGLRKRVIRMSGWRKVLKKSKEFAQDALLSTTAPCHQKTDVISESSQDTEDDEKPPKNSVLFDESEDEEVADFRRNFGDQAVKGRIRGQSLPTDRAYTLDEAAWEYYETCSDNYPAIADKLGLFLKMWDASNGRDAVLDPEISKPLGRLYRDVLRQADFIATTPFAAQTNLRFLRPDIILFDEAGHAREVSTLMSVVYFRPKAWIFVGDYRQIRPYISQPSREKGESGPPLLFRISAMERLAENKLAHKGLLINHRARAGLHQLPSDVFYNGKMTSGLPDELPITTRKLREYLDLIRGGDSSTVPRLVVDISDGFPSKSGMSWYNPDHQKWVMDRLGMFLEDDTLKSTNGEKEASILIVCPYKASVMEYEDAIAQKYPLVGLSRVMIRTTNTCQGIEADIVIADLARCSDFVNDPRRLCVTLTRARQAEIIMLNQKAAKGWFFLRRIWNAAEAAGQTVSTTRSQSLLPAVSEW